MVESQETLLKSFLLTTNNGKHINSCFFFFSLLAHWWKALGYFSWWWHKDHVAFTQNNAASWTGTWQTWTGNRTQCTLSKVHRPPEVRVKKSRTQHKQDESFESYAPWVLKVIIISHKPLFTKQRSLIKVPMTVTCSSDWLWISLQWHLSQPRISFVMFSFMTSQSKNFW